MATIAIVTVISDAYQGDPGEDIKARICGNNTITNGLIVYDDPTTGTMLISDATSGTTEQVTGINLTPTSVSQGQSMTIMRKGVVAGFNLSALNFGALVYLDVTGTIATTANGTKTVVIGKVVASPNLDASGNVIKLLAVDFANLSVIT